MGHHWLCPLSAVRGTEHPGSKKKSLLQCLLALSAAIGWMGYSVVALVTVPAPKLPAFPPILRGFGAQPAAVGGDGGRNLIA